MNRKMNDYENIILTNLEEYLEIYESIFKYPPRPLDLGTEKYKKNIAFFGCSLTYGEGVKNEDTYPSQIQKLSNDEFNCMNFGVPGGSLDLVQIVFHKVIEHLEFIDCVVVQWPNFYRRMYFEEGTYMGWHPKSGGYLTDSFSGVSDLQYCIVRNLPNLRILNSFKKTFNLSPNIGHEQKHLFDLYNITNILKFPFYHDTEDRFRIEDGHPNELWYKEYAEYLFEQIL